MFPVCAVDGKTHKLSGAAMVNSVNTDKKTLPRAFRD